MVGAPHSSRAAVTLLIFREVIKVKLLSRLSQPAVEAKWKDLLFLSVHPI
jgi:hypothetical protein